MGMMNWSDVEIFLAIAREGTLGAAARRLAMTQPTMGRRIKKLEDSLGCRLFQRTPDGFILTDEGSVILGHAERMEEEAFALQRELTGAEKSLDGSLRVSSSDWFGWHVLSPLIGEFCRSYPNVSVELLTDARLLSLPRREADIVFRITPFTEPDVISRRILTVEYGVYVQDGHNVDRPEVMNVITMDDAFSDMPDARWLKSMFPNSHIAGRSNSRDVQARLCQEGVGAAVLPRLLARSYSGLVELPLAERPPSRTTWVGYHRDMRRSRRLRAFLEMALARLGKESMRDT
ncbi:LysR family transcriptional regulator [Thalassospira sp. SM2505]